MIRARIATKSSHLLESCLTREKEGKRTIDWADLRVLEYVRWGVATLYLTSITRSAASGISETSPLLASYPTVSNLSDAMH